MNTNQGESIQKNFPVCDCEKCHDRLCVRRVPIFSGLSEAELRRIASLITRRKYVRGEMILLAGFVNENLVVINKGQAKAFRYSQEGKEQILYIFSEGDFFGETNLLRHEESPYCVEALEETGVCLIHKKDFQQLLRANPDIGFKLMEELSNRLKRLENLVQSMGTNDVELRVNAVLLDLADKYGKEQPGGILIELPLSREGIANYIGLARETVSRKMNLLQDYGIIEMIGNKKVIIKDLKKLQESVK